MPGPVTAALLLARTKRDLQMLGGLVMLTALATFIWNILP